MGVWSSQEVKANGNVQSLSFEMRKNITLMQIRQFMQGRREAQNVRSGWWEGPFLQSVPGDNQAPLIPLAMSLSDCKQGLKDAKLAIDGGNWAEVLRLTSLMLGLGPQTSDDSSSSPSCLLPFLGSSSSNVPKDTAPLLYQALLFRGLACFQTAKQADLSLANDPTINDSRNDIGMSDKIERYADKMTFRVPKPLTLASLLEIPPLLFRLIQNSPFGIALRYWQPSGTDMFLLDRPLYICYRHEARRVSFVLLEGNHPPTCGSHRMARHGRAAQSLDCKKCGTQTQGSADTDES
jgi:hypothetical protein